MKKAEKIYNDYWEAVPALTAFKEAAEREWELSGRKTVVAGDGRKLRVRSKHSILNVLLQSLGSLCMKQTYVFLMQKLEAEGHLVNMFKDDAESIKNKVASMIIYHKQIVAL